MGVGWVLKCIQNPKTVLCQAENQSFQIFIHVLNLHLDLWSAVQGADLFERAPPGADHRHTHTATT